MKFKFSKCIILGRTCVVFHIKPKLAWKNPRVSLARRPKTGEPSRAAAPRGAAGALSAAGTGGGRQCQRGASFESVWPFPGFVE